MAHLNRTFKIGEHAKGGIIQVIIKNDIITVIGKDWDYYNSVNKCSNKSNTKEFTRKEFSATSQNSYKQLYEFIIDLTTSYWTNKILNWIQTKVELKTDLI